MRPTCGTDVSGGVCRAVEMLRCDDAKVTPERDFRPDLYRGTAPFYDRYRPPYPEALFDDLRQRVPLSGHGRVLDLACGTGQIAFALARHAAEVIAVDQEGESVTFAQAKAEAAGVSNITLVTDSAETMILHGPFELVAVGNAFQRLNRPIVARRIFSLLQPGGAVALLWGDSPWAGDLPWQTALGSCSPNGWPKPARPTGSH